MLSEGYDGIQENADSIIHYDLPQNPQKVEQRIGRIDRLGQQSDSVEVRYLIIKDSADHRFLSGMNKKIKSFEETVGKMRPITPENFVDLSNYGSIDREMNMALQKMNLEAIKALDFSNFNQDDLPEEIREKTYPSDLVSIVFSLMIDIITPSDCHVESNSEEIIIEFKNKEDLKKPINSIKLLHLIKMKKVVLCLKLKLLQTIDLYKILSKTEVNSYTQRMKMK